MRQLLSDPLRELLRRRPVLFALAGSNGSGKTSFYRAYLRKSQLPFVNADQITLQTQVDVYKAAKLADDLRRNLLEERRSFIFETVFSDPVGDKLAFLKEAESAGYTVVLLFVGIASPELSDLRVTMRVSKGGHDVPAHKIVERYARTLANLKRALCELRHVIVYDNSDLDRPYRIVAVKQP
jgi:predicted ABC-type ATPase